ncbi:PLASMODESMATA CALLOSE-BINDING PROTEIN 3 isoform X2 [Phoenix dactylifera]|uniref:PLASMODESMATA CALLOSE-BINDING PROTEIN 3 isoform X2 n=1 Tax=Phoenix dactylifera TaxID=42345 RepID=A0A8B7BUZ8_PHODC|nr:PLASMODESMATA CALLOSE-BINDING PROTEIN 3 isoform X2 [Phoenix dactylifera]
MATTLVMVLMLAMIGGSDAAWCVCKSDQGSAALQKALDYACGAGADCRPIQQNGICYNPNTVVAHCSYAVNSYYQKKGQAQQACDFSGTATITSTDPSSTGCTYPKGNSSAGTSTTPSTPTTPSTGTTSGTTPSTFSPPSSTGTGGVLGGLGPSGNTISTEGSDGGFPSKAGMGPLLLTIMFSGMVLLKS